MRLAEYLTHVLGYMGRDSTTKLRHLTTQSLNHQILKFGGALITIDCVGLSYMDFDRIQVYLWSTFKKHQFVKTATEKIARIEWKWQSFNCQCAMIPKSGITMFRKTHYCWISRTRAKTIKPSRKLSWVTRYVSCTLLDHAMFAIHVLGHSTKK